MLAISVETSVGVLGELVGLAAVNVVPPVADQGDLVEELYRKQIMTKNSKNDSNKKIIEEILKYFW